MIRKFRNTAKNINDMDSTKTDASFLNDVVVEKFVVEYSDIIVVVVVNGAVVSGSCVARMGGEYIGCPSLLCPAVMVP